MAGTIPHLSILKKHTSSIAAKANIVEENMDQRLSELNSGTSRMIDTFAYDYVDLVRNKKEIPFAEVTNDKVRVAIIGAGYAGATAAYELRRAGVKNITVYEARDKIGGRADSRSFKHDGREYINEMGPMRVPENSKLFWHYFSEALTPEERAKDPLQKIFPNPGVVATQLVYRGLSYSWIGNESPQPDDPNNKNNVDWEKLQKDFGGFVASLTFNGDSVKSISQLLTQPTLKPSEKRRISTYWSYFLKKYDDVSFIGALEAYFKGYWTPTEFNMFSTLGVGTGGFGPIFPVCFLEIFRLLLWEYSNEFSPNVSMERIVQLLLESEHDLSDENAPVNLCYETVDYVGVDKNDPSQVNVYSIVPEDDQKRIRKDTFDYVIVATTLRSMQIRMNLDAENSPLRYTTDNIPVFSGSSNNMLRESIRIPNIMNSSKLFGFLAKKPWITDPKWPYHNHQNHDPKKPKIKSPVKCVLTDTLARQMYFLDPYEDANDAGSNVLISYNWGDDSVKIMGIVNYDPNQNINPKANKDYALKEAYQTGLETMIKDSPVGKSLQQITIEDQEKFLTSIIWQNEPMIFGAFKLDFPQQFYYTSQVVYQYHQANKSSDNTCKRVYLAGNNASFQGGWIEGAMQSSVNAVSAVLKQMEENGEARNFRMQELFNPNPFQHVLDEMEDRYHIAPPHIDVEMDQFLASKQVEKTAIG